MMGTCVTLILFGYVFPGYRATFPFPLKGLLQQFRCYFWKLDKDVPAFLGLLCATIMRVGKVSFCKMMLQSITHTCLDTLKLSAVDGRPECRRVTAVDALTVATCFSR